MIEERFVTKDRLKWTWKIFFSAFGKLLPVQRETIPKILNGSNLLVISSTASGKTEAVVCPICEILIEEFGKPVLKQGLLVLYISPTRALVNDLYKRLNTNLDRLSISCATKTSDRNDFNLEHPQNFLFTTPESADSLASRRPEVFRNLRYIVLDELHLIDGTYRGDQVRVLMRRILDLSAEQEKIKFYALSATIENPIAVGERYFSKFEVVQIPGSREIESDLIHCTDISKGLEQVRSLFRSRNFKKALFFCNSRKETVRVAQHLKDIYGRPDRIFEHHSAVSSNMRKFVEMEMGKSHNILSLCAATTSLEVGIDIGDIDAIVLIRPPPTVSSLLQRIGRGNRRLNKSICYGLYTDTEEREIFEETLRLAREGILETFDYVPDKSVAIQQVLSFIFQHRNLHTDGAPMHKVEEYLRVLGLTQDDIEKIIEHLIRNNWIKERFGRLEATQKLLDFDDRVGTRGKINSNIPIGGGYKVIDESGKEIGEVGLVDCMTRRFMLAGQKWQVMKVMRNKIRVKRIQGDAEVPRFTPHHVNGYFYSWLPPEMQDDYSTPD